MTQTGKYDILNKMKEIGIIPVFYHVDEAHCIDILQTCYDAGIKVFEFTNRGSNSLENFKQMIAYRDKHLPDLKIGIGSIVDAYTASAFLMVGADFIVSPIFNPEIAKLCNRRKILWIPGCGSLTEISEAEELGADIVKLFPGQHFGAGYVKAIKGPCPWTEIMPTGGISLDPEDLEKWFKSGISCFGIGSKLFGSSGNETPLESLKTQIKEAISAIQKIRSTNK